MKAITFLLMINISMFGQTIRYSDLEKAGRGEYSHYISKDGYDFQLGDKIRIGTASNTNAFANIYIGNALAATTQQLPARFGGTLNEITKIKINGTRRGGYFAEIKVKGQGLSNYHIQIENAMESGEVKKPFNRSDFALAELKKAKEKLDLQLITQRQYDSLKGIYQEDIK